MANPLDDLDARIAALESRELGLDDLPLAALQRRLVDSLQPDGDTFVLPKSIGAPSLEDAITNGYLKLLTQANRKLAFGTGIVTWPGGFPDLQTTISVAHGLGVTPALAGVFPANGQWWVPNINQNTTDATNIKFTGRTFDGTSPAGGSTANYYWLAIG